MFLDDHKYLCVKCDSGNGKVKERKKKEGREEERKERRKLRLIEYRVDKAS